MPYKNYYLAKSLQACIAMMIMVCSVASLMGQVAPPLVKGPDYAIPIDFTIKIQMKTKKLIKNARTFDNKILEVKDVLNDHKSVYLKGLAEGFSTLELISTDADVVGELVPTLIPEDEITPLVLTSVIEVFPN